MKRDRFKVHRNDALDRPVGPGKREGTSGDVGGPLHRAEGTAEGTGDKPDARRELAEFINSAPEVIRVTKSAGPYRRVEGWWYGIVLGSQSTA
jgi:hypothetical protein